VLRVIDIYSGGKYPSNLLSNFAHHNFTIDGVKCESMEGFLESLKFKSTKTQKEVCALVGYNAKKRGRDQKWYLLQTLYWQNKEFKRYSKEYQDLLDRAFTELYKNINFKNALNLTKGFTLTHTIGKKNMSETILTVKEFCSRLTTLRDKGTLKKLKSVNLF